MPSSLIGPPSDTHTAEPMRAPEPARRRRERQRALARRRRRRTWRRVVTPGATLVAICALTGLVLFAPIHVGRRPVTVARVTQRRRSRRAGHRRSVGSHPGHHVLSVGGEPAAVLPFAPNPRDRPTRPREVPSLYADGVSCSTGCRPAGAELGWPIKPFHSEHALRAGLNELRPGSLHVGVDIQARDGTAVYAVQPGLADVLASTGPSSRVRVGDYIYWHITPSVLPGEPVVPFRTVIGHVQRGYGHLAFSELDPDGRYVNPLRPGGIVLSPYVNRAPPEIARPDIDAEGDVDVAAYSPQTFVQDTTYPTPPLAPAAIAWRLSTLRGVPVTALQWSFRGTHLLPFDERGLIYTSDSRGPGFRCFATRPLCIPHWDYRVAGGLTEPLPRTLPPGRYRLTIYAWDWADETTALDTTATLTAGGWTPIGRLAPPLPVLGTRPVVPPIRGTVVPGA